MWLDKCLKSHVSETPFESQHAKGLKQCLNLDDSSFIDFFITLGETELENVPASDLRTVSEHIDCR